MNAPPYPHRPADPVRSLLHRHRELCARAVDPLEIAAALEAHGITDRTAARYRHRDVFSLAEELYARTPREADGADGADGADAAHGADGPDAGGPGGGAPAARAPRHGRGAGRARSAGAALLPLLPGGLCAAAPAAYALSAGLPAPARTVAGAAGVLLVLLSVRLCLRGTALNRTAVLGGCLLAGHALAGGLPLAWALDGHPPAADVFADAFPGEWCVPLGLALAVAPAVWCARWFAARARRRLGTSRGLEEFAARTRPLFAAAVALFAVAQLAVLAVAHAVVDGGPSGGPSGSPSGGPSGGVAGAVTAAATGPEGARIAGAAALGTLLFVAMLLSAHGFPAAAAGGVVAACALEAAALAAAAASGHLRPALPGHPVEALATAWGPAAVPAAACAGAAMALSVFAASRLTGASAHHREGP
ncbi:hypothetical protein [Streptomyces barkulensis]|uniref:hypothetical protein n=1 Tax=Streptomyces barkulensis TaxID=1257026 RepID=UPI000C6D4AA6|nr:hypothetical protein [Streptomyces barkulensis]